MATRARKPKYLGRRYLAPDERVLAEVHGSRWLFFWKPALAIAIAFGAEYVLAATVDPRLPRLPRVSPSAAVVTAVLSLGGHAASSAVLVAVVVATLLVAVWVLYARWLRWVRTLYVVTNDRLIKQIGVFRHDTEEIGLRQVRSVDIYQSAWRATILGYGTLQIRSLADVRFAEGTGTWVGMLPNSVKVDPYRDPADPATDEQGCEWWFSIADPVRVQRTIEDAIEKLEQGRAFDVGPTPSLGPPRPG